MRNSSVITNKGLKLLSMVIIALLALTSVAVFSVSAAEAETVSWSPLKAVTDSSKAPTAVNPEFIWGFYDYSSNDGVLAADNYVYDSSSNTAFFTVNGYDNIGYTYMLPDDSDKVKDSISVNITADYGMKFGFKPTEAGRYYVSEVLGITEADNAVYYRASVESSGKRTAVTETLSGNEGAVLNFAGLTADLAVGDTLWLEVWSDSAAALRIDNPMFTKLSVVSDDINNTETLTYDSYDFNFYSNFGENQYSHLVNTDNSNPWKLSMFTISSTNPDDELEYIVANKYNAAYSSNSSKFGIYTKTLDSSKAMIRGFSNDITYKTSAFLYSKYGISYEFTLPQDGYLKFTQTAYVQIAYLKNFKYRVYKLDISGNKTVITDWTTFIKDLSNVDFGEMKKGEKAVFEFCRIGSSGQYFSCQPIAELTVAQKTVLGDANGDKTVNIKDLVYLKKVIAGTIEPDSRLESAVDIEGDGIDATELAVMRRALLNIETHEEYAAKIVEVKI